MLDIFPIEPNGKYYFLESPFLEWARVVVGGFFYRYRIEISVKRSCRLKIKDASGDVYYLWCFLTGKHYVDYNSSAPSIIDIWEW